MTKKKPIDSVVPENMEAVEAINDSAEHEPEAVIETAQETVKEIPTRIQMTKDFRIEYPLPCRRDTSMSLTLKAGQEITDKFMIKHLLTNVDAPFIIKQ
jgi:hypothetical protein